MRPWDLPSGRAGAPWAGTGATACPAAAAAPQRCPGFDERTTLANGLHGAAAEAAAWSPFSLQDLGRSRHTTKEPMRNGSRTGRASVPSSTCVLVNDTRASSRLLPTVCHIEIRSHATCSLHLLLGVFSHSAALSFS